MTEENISLARVQGYKKNMERGGGLIKSKKHFFDVETRLLQKNGVGVWGLIQVKKNIFLMFNIRLQKQVRSAPSRCKFKQGQNYIIFSSNLSTARQLPDNCPKLPQGKFKQGQNWGVHTP